MPGKVAAAEVEALNLESKHKEESEPEVDQLFETSVFPHWLISLNKAIHPKSTKHATNMEPNF